jgi:hypothetical protein
MRNRPFHLLGACTVAAITAAFAIACADQPTAVLDERLGPGDADLGVTSTPNQQDWRQCRNDHDRETECAWITSTLNATHNTYFEGDMVPKALRIASIVGNEPFEVVMTYGFLHGGKTTHDFLGRWNLDMVNANPCTNSRYSAFCTNGVLNAITTESNSMAALSQAAVDAACSTRPEMQAAMTAAILAVGANDLVIEAIDFADVEVTNITFDGCPVSGNAEAYLTMSVTPVAGKTEGLLLFGAHVARGFDWPNGGAGDVNGSPYHLGLVSVDDQAAGSMDLQMSANAIVVPGSITVEKVCIGSSEGTFDYTGTVPGGGPLAPFDLDCGETLTVVEGTDFGQYTITEDVPTGWELTDIECTAGSTSLATATATVDLAEGQHVHCTFENTSQGSITIVKNTIGGDGTFDYTAGGAPLANFSITTVAGTGNEVFNNVSPGAYTVTEDGPPAGWAFVGLVCVGNGPAGSVVGQTANIDLEAGGSVTCTFTNELIPVETCEAGDRVTSVTLEVISASPDPLRIEVTDDNGPNYDVLLTVDPATVGTIFTVDPEAPATFFDSQNLRFALGPPNGPATISSLKVHLSCSDDPQVGDLYSGSVGGFAVTLKLVAFSTTSWP